MTERFSTKPGEVDGDDLFDLPVEALNLPGMDALDTATALAEFKRAEPAIAALASLDEVPAESPEPSEAVEESQPSEALEEIPEESPASPIAAFAPRFKRLWIAGGALALGAILGLGLTLTERSPSAPKTAELEPTPHDAEAQVPAPNTEPEPQPHVTELHFQPPVTEDPPQPRAGELHSEPPAAEHHAGAEVAEHRSGPPVAEHRSGAPVAEHRSGAEVAELPAKPQVVEHAHPLAAQPEPRAVSHASTAEAVTLPVASRSGRQRLQSVESSLAAGRRAFARAELGRLLLDIDALPSGEREDTRAQAEFLAARMLQDTVDEARRSAR